MSTLLVMAPGLAHTKAGHPENHTRMTALVDALERSDIMAELTAVSPQPATIQQLRLVHAPELIEQIRTVSARGGGLLDHGDTYATVDSYELARLAAGGCCTAVDRIMTGKAQNGMALVRPPGHHAEANRVSGFCLFNNIAVAARHAQAAHNARRVLIFDFDVHHGNGTQDIFYYDDTVLFVSMHLFAPFFYPGIGSLKEIGHGTGEGYTLNVPLPPGVGDNGYRRLLQEAVSPRIIAFQPDLILVSIGFDAHWQDPLASAGLSLTGYAHIARDLLQMADELCDGRILFILEGGYHLDVLTAGVHNVLNVLRRRHEIQDEFGPSPYAEPDITNLLSQLKRRHLPK
ncbi:MAG: histone deacetylase [Chloroflexi bacterium]|nr:histone deacetylase [Chloroflexota bacterium]